MDPPKYEEGYKNSDFKDPSQLRSNVSEKHSIQERMEPNTPIYQEQNLNNWEFVIFNSAFTSNLEVFVSKDSLDKYKAFKKNSNGQMQSNINELQRDGIGIPLLKANGSNLPFNSKFLTIYKFKQPEIGKKFDSKVDRFVFCNVTHTWHKRCHKYMLKFDPVPGDLSKTFGIDMFRHHSLPIVDFLYQGRKYRWICESSFIDFQYSYILFELNYDQISMTDDIDVQKKLPNKNNPLMKNSLKNFFSFNARTPKKEYYSDFQIAELRRLSDLFMGSYRQTATLITPQKFINEHINNESVHSIDIQTLVNICLALVLKRHKDQEKQARDASSQ